MAIGFIPSEEQRISIQHLSTERVVASLWSALLAGKWEFDVLEERSIIADNASFLRAGHTLEIAWQEQELHIVCKLNGIITDLGSSAKVLKHFIDSFQQHAEKLEAGLEEEYCQQYRQRLERLTKDPGYHWKTLVALLLPSRSNWATFVLAHSLWFMSLIAGFHGLPFSVEAGANIPAYTLQGEWWRIGTALFLHLSIFHLLINVLNVLVIGALIEKYAGAARTLFLFLLGGMLANLSSACMHAHNTLSAGASGALFVWLGYWITILLSKKLEDDSKRTYLFSSVFLIGIALLSGWNEDIDQVAHWAGFSIGLLAGLSEMLWNKTKTNPHKVVYRIGFTTIAILLLYFSIVEVRERVLRIRQEVAASKAFQTQWKSQQQQCRVLLNQYQALHAKQSLNERYGLAEDQKQAFQQGLDRWGTIPVEYLSDKEKSTWFSMRLFLQKNISYCDLLKVVISPGGEGEYRLLEQTKKQIDSLNYTIFTP
ncbi:MAG: rhomboid family intramembrane serine protease [Cytophagaceae bacterium]|jgi:membrane associated rhomboid family serine protease|nr:rhomboid family intramembrane serine protease [Cytophagaceae bacterium]